MISTVINSNGSKWSGQNPDSIETLLNVLDSNALDPAFEEYGDFYEMRPMLMGGSMSAHKHHFFGNFFDVSHVFNIDTDDDIIAKRIIQAVWKNKRTAAYTAAKSARNARRKP